MASAAAVLIQSEIDLGSSYSASNAHKSPPPAMPRDDYSHDVSRLGRIADFIGAQNPLQDNRPPMPSWMVKLEAERQKFIRYLLDRDDNDGQENGKDHGRNIKSEPDNKKDSFYNTYQLLKILYQDPIRQKETSNLAKIIGELLEQAYYLARIKLMNETQTRQLAKEILAQNPQITAKSKEISPEFVQAIENEREASTSMFVLKAQTMRPIPAPQFSLNMA